MLGFTSTETVDEDDKTLIEQLREERREARALKENFTATQKSLQEVIECHFADLFESGIVQQMPATDEPVEIQEGIDQKRIHENGRFDAWVRESDPGAELPAHKYPDHDRFIVLVDGKMTVTIDPGTGEEEELLLSDEDGERQVLHLKPGETVSAESIDGTVTVQVFHPPVATEEVESED